MVSNSALPVPPPPSGDGPAGRTLIKGQDAEDIANYVSHMASEMAAMSRAAGFDLLAYFLDMARIEASIQAGRREE